MEKPTWKEEFSKVNQCEQRQDSTDDQMLDLIKVANKLGFYDAADLIERLMKI